MTAERTADARPPVRDPHAGPPVLPPPPPPPARPGLGGALKRLLVPGAVLGATVAAFTYVASVDPNEPGHYPVCPLLALTGVLCPGCGGLRSAYAFAHGDLPTALQANAPAVIGYLLFAAGMALWLTAAARGRRLRIRLHAVHGWLIGGVLLTFTVVRNLPFGTWLRP